MAAARSPTLFASAGPASAPTDVADDHPLLTLDWELDFLLERIEDLESHDLKQLETDEFTFRRQKNSQDSVIVRNALAVPPEFNRYELKVDGPLYLDVIRALSEVY
jgi:hypothetical protein